MLPPERVRSRMAEGPDRSRVVDGPRDATEREWELFRRASIDEPLVHAGSVTAPSAPVAYEQAATLFPDAADLWLCPATEMHRYASAALGTRAGEDGTADERETGGGDEAKGTIPTPAEGGR